MKKALLILTLVLVGCLALTLVLDARRLREAPATPLILAPDLVVQAGQTRATASGFYPEETVRIAVVDDAPGSRSNPIRDTRAGLDGRIDSVNVVFPTALPAGVHRLVATGVWSGRQSTATVYLRSPSPWLTILPGGLKPVAPIGLSVGGFATSEAVVISMSPAPSTRSSPTALPPEGSKVLGVVPTNRIGDSPVQHFLIPYKTAGPFEVVARGQTSREQVERTVVLTPYRPTVALSPTTGPPGVRLQLNARGYAPGESVAIYVGAATAPDATVVADCYGNFWGAGNVPVPYSVLGGPLEVRATGLTSGASIAQIFDVKRPLPWLRLSAYSGAPTAPVELSGGGWAADEQVTFYVSTSLRRPVLSGRTDGYGWLHDTGPLYIPSSRAKQLTIVAVGSRSHAIAMATFTIVVPFGLSRESPA